MASLARTGRRCRVIISRPATRSGMLSAPRPQGGPESAQAKIFEPFTRRMLETAGVSQGMRALDIGSAYLPGWYFQRATRGPFRALRSNARGHLGQIGDIVKQFFRAVHFPISRLINASAKLSSR